MPLINGVYRPDFQAPDQLPTWQPIGDDDQGAQAGQTAGSFVDMLKSRMSKRSPMMHGDMGHADTAPPMAPHELPPISGGEHGLPLASKGIGSGGMKSL